MRRMLGELLSHDNARLTVECLALVSGLQYTGASMTEIAKRTGVEIPEREYGQLRSVSALANRIAS